MTRDTNLIPASLFWFGLTAIIFLLQWFPFTGIFLMLVMAPLWSVVTVNLGFLSLGLEAALGRISRLWLLAPVAWFGGYAILAEQSEQAVTALDAEVRAANAAVKVAFDPAQQALVFVNGGSEGNAQRLLLPYRVPVAYTRMGDARRKPRPNAVPERDDAYTAYRIGAATVCTRIASDKRFGAARVYGSTVSSQATGDRDRDRSAPRDACAYHLPEAPVLPAITVDIKTKSEPSWLLALRRSTITVTEPNGRTSTVTSGHAAPLMRWPMPVMGCALNSGKPAWECSAGFFRQKPRGIGGEGSYGAADVAVIAGALGLAQRAWTAAELEALGAPTLDTVLAVSERTSVENLDTVLADPSIRAGYHELRGLPERPDILAPRAEAIVWALSAAIERGDGNDETINSLQRLFAALPEAEFARHGPALLELLEREFVPSRNRNLKRRSAQSTEVRRLNVDATLMTRSADLGPISLPLLERHLRAKRPHTAAIFGLCRLGPPAARLADLLAEKASDQRPHDDAFKAIYVTLLRLGRTDLADRLVPLDEPEFTEVGPIRMKRSNFPALRRTVTSASPTTVCSHNYRADDQAKR